MRRGPFIAQGRGALLALSLVCALACAPEAGNKPSIGGGGGAAGGAAARLGDAGPIFHGITEPPPDATILHPGEGGIRIGDLAAAKKLDLLFMIDDSSSMGDKHDVLKAAIPDLLARFVNPVCIDRYGATTQPSSADALCPVAMSRQFAPVRDIHIGMITSSLGVADVPSAVCKPELAPAGNDAAHFVGALARASSIPTYPGGFLVWDPDQKAVPAGQKDLPGLIDSFGKLVDAVGQAGCGYENQLESWYRALVDPEPRVATRLLPCGTADSGVKCPGPDGIDQVVLDQRAAFLRPDSLLVIVMLTDENDCSLNDVGSTLLGESSVVPPAGSAACATNPDDPCCYPCLLAAPAGCPNPDAACSVSKTYVGDEPNLRCYDGKRRFGFDPLYPVKRYIDALTQKTVPSRSGATVPNPIFAGGQRTPSQIVLVGIAGVPWEDVATDATRTSPTALELKSSRDLVSGAVWDVILGDPATRVPPKNPLMVESVPPRTGADPITGQALAPPTAGLLANPTNGHERVISPADDLQYACIFPLPTTRDCAGMTSNCDCSNPGDGTMSPLCQAADGTYTTVQRFAKAQPALRILQVIEGVGDAGILTSICPKNITDPSSEAYGYRPVIGTLAQDVAPVLIR
ncbi:MAG TPA: hypothetical protein VH062_22640 [Polyangiaceae bacterium]|jgi:hypothetical protein|nr:hypothetical protein [Polyangiaceae bacterium]